MTTSPDVERSRRERGGRMEIGEDLDFQRRTWIVERIGWIVTAVVLLAGGLGLLGSAGPLNRVTAGETGGPLSVEYARLVRHGAPTELRVMLGASATADDEVRIAVSRAYVSAVDIVEVVPEPQDVELGPDELVYVFPVAERGAPLTVAFEIEPQEYWRRRGTVGLPDGETLSIAQFVYP